MHWLAASSKALSNSGLGEKMADAATTLDQLAAVDPLWPIPLEAAEAKGLLRDRTVVGDLLHISIATKAGLGRRAILPGGFAYTTDVDDAHARGRLSGPDGKLAAWLIDRSRGKLTAVILESDWDESAICCGVLFLAIVSSAAAADLSRLEVLLRLDHSNLVAALGHAFGAELLRLLPGSSWIPGISIQ